MTTNELKKYIDKVLGNSIRCLLPSYWWKNLFHSVADRIDEVEQKVDDIVIPKPASASSVLFITPLAGEELSAENKKTNAASYRKVVNGFANNEFYDVKIFALFLIVEATVISNPQFTHGVLKLMYEYDSKVNVLSVLADGSATLEETDNSNGLISGKERYAYVSRHKGVYGNIEEFKLSEEQKAYNQETNEMLKSGGKVYLSYEGTFWMQVGYSASNSDYTFFFSTASMVIPHEDKIFGRIMSLSSDGSIDLLDTLVGGSSEGGSDIIVDTEMSDSSENAVQNKVVTNALNNKVDKVEGKQLSTEDFTTALKTKLEGLSNYDDTELSEAVARLRDDFDSLTQEDISAAIENFNEIISFLDGIEDSESLDSIIASIEQQIASKQDKLVSGTNIKTINGESILGEGNIVVNVDTSHLATKEEVTNLQNEVIANEEVSAAAFNEINERIEQLSENVSGAAATKEELAEAVVTLNGSIATKADADSTSASIASLEESVSGINASLANYATKESLANEVDTITNTIIENEEITATALTNLDARIKEIIARLDALEG